MIENFYEFPPERKIDLHEVKKGSKIIIRLINGPLLELKVIYSLEECNHTKVELSEINSEGQKIYTLPALLVGTVLKEQDHCEKHQLIKGGYPYIFLNKEYIKTAFNKKLPPYLIRYEAMINNPSILSNDRDFSSFIARRIEDVEVIPPEEEININQIIPKE